MGAQPWVWTLDDGPSDLAGGGSSLGNGRLLRYSEGTGTLVLTVPFASSATLWFFSPANQPGASDWPVGAFLSQLRIVSGNAHVTVRLAGINRVSGVGAVLDGYAAASADIAASTGTKSFSGTTVAPASQPSAGDRLRIGFTFTHDGSFGSTAVTVGFGDPTTDILQVPILMANPQIVWAGNTLTFPGPLTGYFWRLMSDRVMDVSAGRVSATGHRSCYDQVRAVLANFDDAQFAVDLVAWWAHARQGKQYAFALDPSDVVDLAMSGAAAAGQKDVPLSNTSSIVIGRKYRLREAAGPEEEVIQVASVTTNVKLTAVANLKFGYLTGDLVRSLDYFPKVVSADSEFPRTQGFTTYGFDHTMVEDRG